MSENVRNIWFSFLVPIPKKQPLHFRPLYLTSHLLSSPFYFSPSRNSDPGSRSRLLSPLPTTVRAFAFLSREDLHFFFARRLASKRSHATRSCSDVRYHLTPSKFEGCSLGSDMPGIKKTNLWLSDAMVIRPSGLSQG